MKLGEDPYSGMFLLNKDILIVFRVKSLILIDTHKKCVINEFPYEIYFVEKIFLNETSFLCQIGGEISLYKLEKNNNLVMKGKTKIEINDNYNCLIRYPGNILICHNINNIVLLGYN